MVAHLCSCAFALLCTKAFAASTAKMPMAMLLVFLHLNNLQISVVAYFLFALQTSLIYASPVQPDFTHTKKGNKKE